MCWLAELLRAGWSFAHVGRCRGHSASITSLDWNDGSTLLRSSSVDGELMHWDTAGKLVRAAWPRTGAHTRVAAAAMTACAKSVAVQGAGRPADRERRAGGLWHACLSVGARRRV